MIYLAAGFVVLYCFLLLIFIVIWLSNNIKYVTSNVTSLTGITVIVPVRNEVKNIALLIESIVKQKNIVLELIIVDDASVDETVRIAEKYLDKLDLKILHLTDEERGNAPKKNAITKAMNLAKYDLIFCTDGDCILPENILNQYVQMFQNEKIKFISGPVTFIEKGQGFFVSIWEKLQIVEFASLVGSAAVSIFMGKPNMCSGANLAYRKSTFLEVDGYQGNLNLASGDDEFLMHKIAQKYPDGVLFAKSNECIVQTTACGNLNEFYNQRKRWASKWTHYESFVPKLLAAFVFFVNVSTLFLAFTFSFEILITRLILEFVFLGLILLFFNKNRAVAYIPLVQIIYPFYVIFFGIGSIFINKTYTWKQRKMQ
ncbi:glycosyltransferase [Lacihabitans soyangensis]|uniref:Glycosyltransferase n=1 Tax=Lacihabitans soyangensis TaxID=869394 RepID=A0AAE3H1P4_9BACT|nr:glycosyltransferase [Lacihabitans soyangensis]MCP9763414.1 glycosyltransferase [Lacihabitans soyangensis]